MPMISPESWSTSATVSPMAMLSASSRVAERVIGMGQNRPPASFMSAQTPRQSALLMKPASGVYAPMASMMKSEVSRLLIGTFRKVEARFSSSAISASGAKSGISASLPCGGTSFDIHPPLRRLLDGRPFDCGQYSWQAPGA